MRKLTRATVSAFIIAFATILIVGGMLNIRIARADTSALLQVTPPLHIVANLGDSFIENVTISTSQKIHSVNFTLSYNSTLLDVATVTQGDYFPQHFPPTYFAFEKNSAAGTINVDVEILDPQYETGNGTLAIVTFVPILDPKSFAFSPLILTQAQILDFLHQPLTYDTLNAICFWKYISPPTPPQMYRLVDVYTQQSGIGQNTYGGEFYAGAMVILSANATYNNFPVQHVPVAFQILDNKNQTVALLVGMTDANGVATTQFRIQSAPTVVGTWLAVASVDISCTIVWDTVNFTVYVPIIIGGYTATPEPKPNIMPQYLIILTVLASVITITKRRTRRK